MKLVFKFIVWFKRQCVTNGGVSYPLNLQKKYEADKQTDRQNNQVCQLEIAVLAETPVHIFYLAVK